MHLAASGEVANVMKKCVRESKEPSCSLPPSLCKETEIVCILYINYIEAMPNFALLLSSQNS